MASKTTTKTATKTTTASKSASSSSPSKSTSKPQARSQDSAKLEFSAAGVETEVPADLAALDKERAELQKPDQVSKADAKFIDADPGYDKDQTEHMREYYGLTGNVENPGNAE